MGFAQQGLVSLSKRRTTSSLLVQSQRSYVFKCVYISNLYYIQIQRFSGIIKAYLMKSLRPKSAEFFFMTLHDFTTRASCSSVNTIFPSLSISSEAKLLDLLFFFCNENCVILLQLGKMYYVYIGFVSYPFVMSKRQVLAKQVPDKVAR